MLAALVRADHHARGLWQLSQPLRQVVLLLLPRPVLAGRGVHAKKAAVVAGGADGFGESVAAPVRPVGAADTAETEMLEVVLEKVRRRHAGHRRVIEMNQRQPRLGDHSQHVNHRNLRLNQRLRHRRAGDAGDDPVAVPLPQPARHRFGQASRLVEHRPGAMLADVTGDPLKHLAPRPTTFPRSAPRGRGAGLAAD